ncbi:MAG TPA: alpha/beta hydrolase [Terrimesophilobacter sp.]|nr:alpha/beta hydrolase [Terrimesophilobacter sp.]
MTAIVKRTDRTFVDAFGVTIHFHVWEANEPRAVVQVLHGLGEHALRYEALAADLVAAGYTVYADEHRGHGATGLGQHNGDHSKLGRLGEGGMPATVAAVRQLTGMIREENPGLPLVLLGHSWGSIIAQKLINQDASDFAAVILSGTAYRTPFHMNGGDLSKSHRVAGGTGLEWLSRDVEVQRAFAADPLTFDAKTLELFGLADSLRLLGRPARNIEHDVPVLIIGGSEDSLPLGPSVKRLADSYLKRSGLTDVKVIIYTDARHEVFNELNRDEVVADVIEWTRSRVA